MAEQRFGSAKKNFPYHNALILHKNKKQTVKDQSKTMTAQFQQRVSSAKELSLIYFSL